MARPRRITLELTPAQYEAILAAVSLAEADWESNGIESDSRQIPALNRAWDKLRDAWNR